MAKPKDTHTPEAERQELPPLAVAWLDRIVVNADMPGYMEPGSLLAAYRAGRRSVVDELRELYAAAKEEGDKGAEAVDALAGYIDYLRYDKAVKYADPTNVAVQTLRLSIAEDLERIASPAAPTQAAMNSGGRPHD